MDIFGTSVGVMEQRLAEIEGCRLAHERLIISIGKLRGSTIRSPSLLPDWTVGHVLSHLARNAEAMVRRIEATREGRRVDQYEGGLEGRAEEIRLGAQRSALDIVADVVDWSSQLDLVFASLSGDEWELPVRTVAGGEHSIGLLPFRRWREVEVHRVDLNIGFGPADWSAGFVELVLPRLVSGLHGRVDDRVLAAWMLGRGEAPELGPWG